MAVNEIKNSGVAILPKDYLGLSTDTKPTDCPVGSTFWATDTKQASIYDGTDWSDV